MSDERDKKNLHGLPELEELADELDIIDATPGPPPERKRRTLLPTPTPTRLESPLDRELDAIRRCVQILEGAPAEARARIAGYLAARFAMQYGPPPATVEGDEP